MLLLLLFFNKKSFLIVHFTQDNLTKLKLLSQKNYLDQAQWFLNAYWSCKEINYESHPEERERVWKYYNSIITMDKKLGIDGNELDEFEAHIFLEKNIEAITVKKMRQVLGERFRSFVLSFFRSFVLSFFRSFCVFVFVFCVLIISVSILQ